MEKGRELRERGRFERDGFESIGLCERDRECGENCYESWERLCFVSDKRVEKAVEQHLT